MSVRDEYAAAVRRNLYDLGCNWDRWLPRLFEAWDAIDEAHVPGGVIKFEGEITEEQAAEFAEKWQAANPAIGVRVKPETVAAPAEQAAAPAKPATRRRTTR